MIKIVIVAVCAHGMCTEIVRPCAEGGPKSRAPEWAVIQQHGNPARDDPIWQHAMCDDKHRTITWSFPQ